MDREFTMEGATVAIEGAAATMEGATVALYAGQVTLNSLVQNLVYASGTVGALLVVVGFLLIDAGTTRRKSLFNSTIEKVMGFFLGFTTYYVIGFSFWAAQYYIMAGGTMMDSIRDWWIGGTMLNAMAQQVDPAVFPGLNNFQVLVFFLACFAGIINILFHFAVSERMKASAYYVFAVVAAVVSSIVSWITWGSVGPLTNAGFHNFFGVGFVFLFPAAMALVVVPMLAARPGVFAPHPRVPAYYAPSTGLAATGLMAIFAGLPMVILSCLFFFAPEALAVSITMANTSVGLVLNNYALSWAGGAVAGTIIAYATRRYAYLLLGPLAGYVAGASGFDVFLPWQTFLVSLGGPVVAWLVYEFTFKRKFDEHKLVPLFIGAGVYGLIMVGLFQAGTPRGGYFGIAEGPFAFQHGAISFWMQLAGIVFCIAAGAATAFVTALALKATIGLRVSDEDMAEGLDRLRWGVETDVVTKEDLPRG
jgi:ammonia channel protein AmtB